MSFHAISFPSQGFVLLLLLASASSSSKSEGGCSQARPASEPSDRTLLQLGSQLGLKSAAGVQTASSAGAFVLPEIVEAAFELAAEQARAELVRGSQPLDGAPPQDVFSSVLISMPVGPPVLQWASGSGNGALGGKNLVGKQLLQRNNRSCTVYGMGISPAASGERSVFEEEMGELGCEVHGFDCSVRPDDPNVVAKPFTFHPWCIGKENPGAVAAFAQGMYGRKGKADQASLVTFKTLKDTMAGLNHTSLRLLKFDIEGNEWELFDNELLPAFSLELPEQLSFELHTEGAHAMYVPPALVEGKGYVAINKLFLKLFDLGYRVAAKELNAYDHKCAEFVLVRV
ncbi:unnamed protein product [Polarella glacialis]|uniref:Methyltransferase domain-containing protein n=1 Tax=Polarella glacialis TaxID=89957 RepID=A0A813JNC7_POLGL|nr:unnamed protein product [Polarella glacialis]|mmetsp:Transcript_78013/g.140757  ORF Transcript_78013/g.140757 Transcript_78013/m.140757 type:complete len:343 (-) Transcript_78013:182-1210(-)